ncbi:acireductone synthase [Thalassolituus pacificus]|uniref:Enolase-phosphatase E1 n=1 Tax=Thalassolituus pacificus TaxID=2975440 RepID=A0A9X3ATN1_9GAMM|nr:acireductone synthase [Thalassolituus pacificus]MCT7360408.1 acireductone synthase [Thalassolituus pacificus]
MTVKLILTDIEGTTSSIAFVKDVLFPYAAQHLPDYIRNHLSNPQVQEHLTATAQLAAAEGLNIDASDHEALIALLQEWIAADRKVTPLKALQGLIWESGYKNRDYAAHMYADATEYLQRWHANGIPLYVYSSGSVQAQKLFFGYSQDGDLLPLFSGHFDTLVGGKREAGSYRNILAELQKQHDIQAADVLFLSDIAEELDAAREAGMQTCWLVRDGALPQNTTHTAVSSFADIVL